MEMLSRLATPEGVQQITVCPGWSVQELIEQNVQPEYVSFIVAFNHGAEIVDPRSMRVQHGDNILLCLVPQGGGGGRKSAMGMILSIAVSVFAWQMAPMLTSAMFGPTAAMNTLGGATLLTNVVGAGISFVGHALLSALIRPPSVKSTPGKQGGQTYSFGGISNQSNPYGAVLRLYGKHKVFPKIAANPLINNVGKHGTITALYDFGLGWIELEDLRIGDVGISTYEPETVLHTNSYCRDMEFMPSRVGYDQMNYNLEDKVPLILNTKQNAFGAAVDISFPQGMFVVDNQGDSQGSRATRVQLRVMYRKLGDSEWTALPVAAYDNDGATSITQPTLSQGSTVNATVYCTKGTFTIVPAIPSGNFGDPGSVTLRDGRNVRTYQAYTTGAYGIKQWSGPRYVVVPPDWIWGNPAAVGQPPYPLGGIYTTSGRWVQQYTYTPATVATYVELYGKVEQPFTLNVSMDFPTSGTYEVYVERIANLGGGTKWDRFTDSVVTLIKSFQKGAVVNLDRRHTMLEMRLRATNKLSGVVNNLSAIGTSVLRQTADGVNFTEAPSRNPAWIAIDLLTSETNSRPVPDRMIDWASWIELANYCDQPVTRIVNGVPVTAPRHQADFVLDSFTTAKELIESLLSGCRASIRIDGAGRYSVLIDIRKTIPRQVITPENSWGFQGSRTFTEEIHALRVSFIDGNRPDGSPGTWNPGEVLCYADGYNADNAKAENIEEMQTFGLTDYASAWAFGRYQLAQGIIRNEQFSVTMGIDNLVCSRGDLVYVAHDVPQIGGVAGRVNKIVGNSISISTPISVTPTAYSVRLFDGSVRTGYITSVTTDGMMVLDNIAGVMLDDLVVVGMVSRVTQPYLVQQITPDSDLTATLTLVKYDEDIYNADTGALPEWDPGFGDDLVNTTDLAIVNLNSEHSLRYEDRYPVNEFLLTWGLTGFNYLDAEVYATFSGGTKELLGTVTGQQFKVIVDHIAEPQKLGYVQFEVVPYSVTGLAGTPGFATGEVVRDTVSPAAPSGFTVNLQDMTTSIFWDMNKDPDIDHYELRYSPDVMTGNWNTSLMVEILPYTVNRTSVGSRTGIYFLQATDTSGNKSEIVWQRTTVEYLPNVNQIFSINDAPGGWQGSFSDTELVGGNVQLIDVDGAVIEAGYYYFHEFLDLTDIYEVRVSSKLLAHGIHLKDEMVYWTPLSDVRPLVRANSSDWNVRLEYRTIDQIEVMDDWPTLDDAICNPLEENYEHYWSVWRPIEVGDVTARLLQFRVLMESFNPDVRPSMIDGLVEVDAVDRIWRKNDIAVPIGGIRVVYDPPFIAKPTIAISLENTTAVQYEIANSNRTGFDIKLFDPSKVEVIGQIDVSALGMGREKTTSI